MKGNAVLVLLLAGALCLSLSACGWVTVTDKGETPPPAPSASEPAPVPSDGGPSAEDLYNDTEAKDAIQAAVEALVDDEYKGAGYSCDILTRSDGSGYIVSLQIDVGTEPPESTEIINNLEAAINGLGNEQIAEIQITALKDMQIVDNN